MRRQRHRRKSRAATVGFARRPRRPEPRRSNCASNARRRHSGHRSRTGPPTGTPHAPSHQLVAQERAQETGNERGGGTTRIPHCAAVALTVATPTLRGLKVGA
eukprot:15462271-Alexandrium_andersonii.AAC.1